MSWTTFISTLNLLFSKAVAYDFEFYRNYSHIDYKIILVIRIPRDNRLNHIIALGIPATALKKNLLHACLARIIVPTMLHLNAHNYPLPNIDGFLLITKATCGKSKLNANEYQQETRIRK